MYHVRPRVAPPIHVNKAAWRNCQIGTSNRRPVGDNATGQHKRKRQNMARHSSWHDDESNVGLVYQRFATTMNGHGGINWEAAIALLTGALLALLVLLIAPTVQKIWGRFAQVTRGTAALFLLPSSPLSLSMLRSSCPRCSLCLTPSSVLRALLIQRRAVQFQCCIVIHTAPLDLPKILAVNRPGQKKSAARVQEYNATPAQWHAMRMKLGPLVPEKEVGTLLRNYGDDIDEAAKAYYGPEYAA